MCWEWLHQHRTRLSVCIVAGVPDAVGQVLAFHMVFAYHPVWSSDMNDLAVKADRKHRQWRNVQHFKEDADSESEQLDGPAAAY